MLNRQTARLYSSEQEYISYDYSYGNGLDNQITI